jgi:hypothetical protein
VGNVHQAAQKFRCERLCAPEPVARDVAVVKDGRGAAAGPFVYRHFSKINLGNLKYKLGVNVGRPLRFRILIYRLAGSLNTGAEFTMQLSLGITLALAAGAAVGFEVKEEGDYDVNYRSTPFSKISREEMKEPSTVKIVKGNPGAPEVHYFGFPIAMARNKEDRDIIIGNPHFSGGRVLSGDGPDHAGDPLNGGIVRVMYPKDNKKFGDSFYRRLGFPDATANSNGGVRALNVSTIIGYADEDDVTSDVPSSCTFNVGMAVAISDDGDTFAYTCRGGELRDGTGDSPDTGEAWTAPYASIDSDKVIVTVARYDDKLKRFKFAEIEGTANANNPNSFGISIALSGDGNTLVIGDFEADTVHVYQHRDAAEDDCDADTTVTTWEDDCKAPSWIVEGNTGNNGAKGGWISRAGDRLILDADYNWGENSKDKADHLANAYTTERMGYHVAVNRNGKYIAITSVPQNAATDDHVFKVRVWKKRSSQGWFFGDNDAGDAIVKVLDKATTDKQLVFSVQSKKQEVNAFLGAFPIVDISDDGDFVAIADFGGVSQGKLNAPADAGVVAICHVNTTRKVSDNKEEVCQYAHGFKANDQLGRLRHSLSLSADGQIVAVGSPDATNVHEGQEHARRRRSPHSVARDGHKNRGYVLVAKRDSKKDAKELKSYAHRSDMEATVNDGRAGGGVACNADCGLIATNDGSSIQVHAREDNEDSEPWCGSDKQCRGAIITIAVLGGVALLGAGVAVAKSMGVTFPNPIKGGLSAPMGYVAADNHM